MLKIYSVGVAAEPVGGLVDVHFVIRGLECPCCGDAGYPRADDGYAFLLLRGEGVRGLLKGLE